MIKLSLCIPTYNRGQFIGETIESIIVQATDEVEIVISDNGSNDNTEELIREYQGKFPRIRYFRWDNNVGADRNFLKVIELATGTYCWFMGSDDRAESGALSHVLDQLDKHTELCGASVNQAIYTPDLNAELKGVPIAGGKLESDLIFNDTEECFSNLGLYFGYLPGQIVNRSLWNKVVKTETLEPYFNAFVHVYVIGRMLKINPNWLYIHKKCVGYRSGNDSFLQEGGVYKRQVIAHASFEKIVRDLFGLGTRTYNEVLLMALTGYMRADLVNFKANGASAGLQLKLFNLYSRIYWRFPFYWFKVFPIFLIPNRFIVPFRNFHRYGLRGTVRP